jgi:hypothetical protein
LRTHHAIKLLYHPSLLADKVLLGRCPTGMVSCHVEDDVSAVDDIGSFPLALSNLWQGVLIWVRHVRKLDVAIRQLGRFTGTGCLRVE